MLTCNALLLLSSQMQSHIAKIGSATVQEKPGKHRISCRQTRLFRH